MYETLITPTELHDLISIHTDLVIVDCRHTLANPAWGPEQYRVGHIPGAIYAHLDHDLSSVVIAGQTGRHPLPDQDDFADWVRRAGIHERTQVVAYDQGGGGIAARLWWLLRWAGHDNVAVLNGGYSAWMSSGFTSDSDVPARQRSSFEPQWKNSLMTSVSDLQKWCHDPGHVIIDSREAQRYAGIEEPIDPVAGHIPGAINAPFAENLKPDGTWHIPAILKERFVRLTGDHESSEVIFYCGSGVTACQNILAFKYAGLGDAILYPGSWSEWITDLSRGVECSD